MRKTFICSWGILLLSQTPPSQSHHSNAVYWEIKVIIHKLWGETLKTHWEDRRQRGKYLRWEYQCLGNMDMILLACPWGQFSSQEVTICLPYHFQCSSFLIVKTCVWMQSLTALSGETVNSTPKIQYPSPDFNQNFTPPSSLTTVPPPPQHATKTCAHERRKKNLSFTFKQDSTTKKFGE